MDVHFTTRVQQHYGVEEGIPTEDAKAVRIVEKASAVAREALDYEILDNQTVARVVRDCKGIAPNTFQENEILRNEVLTLNNNQKYLQACLEQLNTYLEKLSNNALSEEERAWLGDNAPALLEHLEHVRGDCEAQQEELSRHAAALQSKLDPLNVAVDKLKNRIAQAEDLLEEEDSSSESSSEEEPEVGEHAAPQPFDLEKEVLYTLSPTLQAIKQQKKESKRLSEVADELYEAIFHFKEALEKKETIVSREPKIADLLDQTIPPLEAISENRATFEVTPELAEKVAFYSKVGEEALQKMAPIFERLNANAKDIAEESLDKLNGMEGYSVLWQLHDELGRLPSKIEYTQGYDRIKKIKHAVVHSRTCRETAEWLERLLSPEAATHALISSSSEESRRLREWQEWLEKNESTREGGGGSSGWSSSGASCTLL